MFYYNDHTGHWHLWVPFYGDRDLFSCRERTALLWPLRERKLSWLHRLACLYHLRHYPPRPRVGVRG